MNRARTAAFTLVELMVAMTLGMILIGVVAFVFTQSSRLYNTTLDEMHGTFVLRAGQDVLARDLRDLVLPMSDDTLLKIVCTDGGPNGEATDTLEYTTAITNPAGNTVPAKVRVSIQNGFLLHEVLEEGDWQGNFAAGAGLPRTTDLGGNVLSFRVEYAWPDATGMSYRRDTGTGGALAANGTRFAHYGTGTLGTDRFTAGTAYAGGGAPPGILATTLYVLTLDTGGGFRISSPGATNYQLTDSAPGGGGLAFAVPVLPPSLRITIQQMTGVGTRARVRSMQRVLSVSR